MSRFGRFTVRFFTFLSYAALAALTVVFLISQIQELRALGALLALFLLERLLHARSPDRLLSRVKFSSENSAHYLRPEAYKVIEAAFDRTLHVGGDFGLQLLTELVRQPEIKKVLSRLDVSTEKLRAAANQELLHSEVPGDSAALRRHVETLVTHAVKSAQAHYNEAIEVYDLLGAVSALGSEAVKKLYTTFEISHEDLETAFLFAKEGRHKIAHFLHKPHSARHRIMNRSWTARPTPTLDAYSIDFTDLARAGNSGFLVGHASEYERLVTVLSRPTHPNALLVGEPGAGKETIVHHLASQIIADRVPKPLFDKRLVSLSVTGLCAGAEPPEIQKRIKTVISEIVAAGNVILYIPNIHELLMTGPGSITGADVLMSAIVSGDFPVLGATHPKEYKQHIESKGDLAALFEVVRVIELTQADTVKYLIFASMVLEKKTGVTISFSALKAAADISHKYFREKLLPASAEDLLSETVTSAQQAGNPLVAGKDVIEIAEKKTNIALHAPAAEEASELLHLEERIHQTYVDQEEAVTAVSNALREYRSGLARKGGPIASFLFVGPTGVGKTELSKIIAYLQFGSRENMVRFDMTEYQDKQSFFRLIGAPDGSTQGALTEAVREQPYSLVLLDEFEKAYPDILNLFLQVLDDGRLTDNTGRTIDFQNTIIIATSNAHSTLIKEELEKGTSMAALTRSVQERLTEYFRPELLNRFSKVVVFKNLSQADTLRIARLALDDLILTLQENHAVALTFSEEAVAAVARLGYDPVYGARPLRAVISDRLRAPLAQKILKGEVARGSTVSVRYQDDSFIFD